MNELRGVVTLVVLVAAVVGCGGGDTKNGASEEQAPKATQLTGTVVVEAGHSHSPDFVQGARSNISIWADGYAHDEPSPRQTAPPYACQGGADFDDIKEGAPVTVFDGDNRTLGLGRLAEGEYLATYQGEGMTDAEVEHADRVWRWMQRREGEEPENWDGDYIAYTTSCEFDFAIDLNGTAPFYAVEIANRDELRFTHEELQQAGWHIEQEYSALVFP